MADPFTGDTLAVLFPQFAALPNLDATVSSVFNTLVVGDLNAAAFGTDYVKAAMLLTAHWLTLAQRQGGGALLSASVGALSRGFQAMPTQATLDSTTYGQEFRKLARRKVGSQVFLGKQFNPNVGLTRPLP